MSTIVAQIKLVPYPNAVVFGRIFEKFQMINQRGFLTAVCLVLIAISSVGYLMGLYFGFNIGFEIQNNKAAIKQFDGEVVNSQILLQTEKTYFAEKHKDELGGLSKITDLRYITAKSFAVNTHSTKP